MRILAPIALAALLLAGCGRQEAAPAAVTPPAPDAPGAVVNPPTEVVSYLCADGSRVEAGYPDSDTAILRTAEHAYTLKIARSASGARYTGYGLQWWTKGMVDASLAKLKPGEDIASEAGVTCSAVDPRGEVSPPEPGRPGGLPDDRTPVSEAPFTPQSAQGAANVVQTYYALIGAGKYAEAWDLWSDGGRASGLARERFVDGFKAYSRYNAQIGAPGEIEGAAGSLYVEVPVVVYGRYRDGRELHQSGKATLRRVNDVPGSTPEQRSWRIAGIDLK